MSAPLHESVTKDRRIPAAAEPIARGVINFVGGPRGRFAQGAGHPLRIIIAVTWTFLAFGYLAKANCAGGWRGHDGIVNLDWGGNRQYTSACYNDIVPLFGGRGLDQGGFPYAYSWVEGDLTRYMEYPVLAGLFQGAIAWVARVTYPLVEWAVVPEPGWYFALTALAMSLLWVATLILVAQLMGNRIWDAILIAASPLVIMHAFTNWDIPSIFFMVLAMWLVAKHQPAWAGVAIGLGTAFKLWPLFILGAYLVVSLRRRDVGPFILMLGTTILSWGAVNLPVALMYPDAWREFFRLNAERSWEWTTLYGVVARELGVHWSVSVLNVVSFVLFLAGCAVIGLFGLCVKRQPRVAELIFLIVAVFLLCNKVWSPQYSLWLVVPAALALPRWRLVLSWALADALVWPILMLHMLGVDNKGLPQEMLDLAVLTRDGFIVAMMIIVVRQMLGRVPDKVYAAHGGVDIVAGPWIGPGDTGSDVAEKSGKDKVAA